MSKAARSHDEELTHNGSADASNREFWNDVGSTIESTKDSMQPLLHNWLPSGIEGTSIHLD
jgi:hypothetical protein